MIANRTRTFPYSWTEEICSLAHCNNSSDKCEFDGQTFRGMKFARLSGEFSLDTTVYPSVMAAKQQVSRPAGNWRVEESIGPKRKNVSIVVDLKPRQISTIALYGRAYSRDSLYEPKKFLEFLFSFLKN